MLYYTKLLRESLKASCVGVTLGKLRIWDFFEYALYKFTLYLLIYLLPADSSYL